MSEMGWSTYDDKAELFELHATNSVYNAHYDRPAVLALAGDVTGLDVLDAGCGPGLYSEALVERGAHVVAFDASPAMVERAQRRLGDGVDLRVLALGNPLPYDDESFDLVLCALVIHHVDDRATAYRELHRVLRADGRFIVSTHHPVSDWLRLGGSYFTSEAVEEQWGQWGLVRFHRQPLTALVDDLADAGFLIERLVEPQPLPSAADIDAEDYERLMREPAFIALRLRKA